ncbi:hypothetical protein MXB_2991 [Myxobolus squamalis]|nr:hypothetical protein MXB_2991 [Myxobolus squamalis]
MLTSGSASLPHLINSTQPTKPKLIEKPRSDIFMRKNNGLMYFIDNMNVTRVCLFKPEDAAIYREKKLNLEERLKNRRSESLKSTKITQIRAPRPLGLKPRSNKCIIKNALSYYVFSIKCESIEKEKIFEAISKSTHLHYFLYFSDRSSFRLLFRGVYYFDSSSAYVIIRIFK